METETQRQTRKFRLRVCKKLGCKNNFRSVFTHSRRTFHEVAETQNSVSAADLEVRHQCFRVISWSFNSFLQCFLCSKESALSRSINKGRTNPSSQDEAAQHVIKCRCLSSSQFLSRFSTAGHIEQHN